MHDMTYKQQHQQPQLVGRLLMLAHECWYPPAIEARDVLRVDFDRRSIGPDGLYLVELHGEEGGAIWRGCRRFIRRLDGGIEMDRTGKGDWMEVHSLAALNMQAVGYVEQVYKPAEVAHAR